MQFYVEIGSKSIWEYLVEQHKPFWSLSNELNYEWLKKMVTFFSSVLLVLDLWNETKEETIQIIVNHTDPQEYSNQSLNAFIRLDILGVICYYIIPFCIPVSLHFILSRFISLMLFFIFLFLFASYFKVKFCWIALINLDQFPVF